MRKVALANNRPIIYRACAKFVTRFASIINRQVCRQMARVSRNKKNYVNSDMLRKTHARLAQCSKPVKNRKNEFFKFIRPDFWTDLNGCRQRLLFARQLTQPKCSLCSRGMGQYKPKYSICCGRQEELVILTSWLLLCKLSM